MPATPAAWPTGSTSRSTPSISSSDFDRIIDYFADEYLAGRTPNPCVVCNNWLKFGKLWSYGKQLEADFIATGHYARIVAGDGRPELHRAADPDKDQSYVLFGLRRALLPHLLFPIGGYRKDEVRSLAREAGLGVADKPDSVEICFVPDGDHAALIRRRRPELATAGQIVTRPGKVLAEHDGIEQFTIGQRKGLGFAAGSGAMSWRSCRRRTRWWSATGGVAGAGADGVARQLADRRPPAGAAGVPGEDSLSAPGGGGDGDAAAWTAAPREFAEPQKCRHAGAGGGVLRWRPRAGRRLDRDGHIIPSFPACHLNNAIRLAFPSASAIRAIAKAPSRHGREADMDPFYVLDATDWNATFSADQQAAAVQALERGQVLFFRTSPARCRPTCRSSSRPTYSASQRMSALTR